MRFRTIPNLGHCSNQIQPKTLVRFHSKCFCLSFFFHSDISLQLVYISQNEVSLMSVYLLLSTAPELCCGLMNRALPLTFLLPHKVSCLHQ